MKEFKVNYSKPDIKAIENCIPNIYFTKQALAKMKLYIGECENEIGWLGTAYSDEKDIFISDMMLFDQEVSSVTTDIDDEALSKFGEQLLKEEDGVEKWNNIRVWGHSHVNMQTNPSSTDDEQMEEFENIGHDWFVRIIGNKKGDLRVDLYRYDIGVVYHKMPWEILRTKEEIEIIELIQSLEEELEKIDEELEGEISTSVKKDIKDMVREKSSKTVSKNKVKNIKSYIGKNNKNSKDDEDDEDDEYDYYYDYYKYQDYNYYNEYDDFSFDIIHEENIDAGLFEEWTANMVLGCDTLDEIRDTLYLLGFQNMYFYSDKDINDIVIQMQETIDEEKEEEKEVN